MYSKEDLAYLAGFLDGDGFIASFTHPNGSGKTYYQVCLGAVNTDRGVIHWIQKTFGGRVSYRKSKNPKWKDKYEWRLPATEIDKLAPQLLPYLKIKGERVKTALKLRRTYIGNIDPSMRRDFHNELKKLNKRS